MIVVDGGIAGELMGLGLMIGIRRRLLRDGHYDRLFLLSFVREAHIPELR